MSAKQLNDAEFRAEIESTDLPVLVDFWAPWCGPCRAMGPVVDELAEDLAGKVSVVKVNIDEATETAREYGVTSIPTFAIVKNGNVQARFGGAMPKQKLLSHLDTVVGESVS